MDWIEAIYIMAGIAGILALIWSIYAHFSKRKPVTAVSVGDVHINTTTLAHPTPDIPPSTGSIPPAPSLVIGREDDLSTLKMRLGIGCIGKPSPTLHLLTVIRGWPGVGKTTVVSALAHDPIVAEFFPDGILWTSLGPTPNVLSELVGWGRALGIDNILQVKSEEEASALIRAVLKNKRWLLIVDDIWDAADAQWFKVGGNGCALIATTREKKIADAVAGTPADVCLLGVLNDDKALELLTKLTPTVVRDYPDDSMELVQVLEGLPLSLQVAGRMLNTEAGYGFGVSELLTELKEGLRLLPETAPSDRVDHITGAIPTVTVLLQKSTDRLKADIRQRFAMLGPFAPKPATFDISALLFVWDVELAQAMSTVAELIDRGLLERIEKGSTYYWMHALLVAHAKILLSSLKVKGNE